MSGVKALRIALHRVCMAMGIDTRKRRPDRILLERVVIPELARDPQWHRVLFVGCAWYTLHYPRLFRNCELTTLEIDPDLAPYGARRHIIDSCENLKNHVGSDAFDCVIFNGVFGFGIDTPEALERTLVAMHHALRDRGLFVFGWNKIAPHAPFDPATVPSWSHFRPWSFPPINAWEHISDAANGHRFQFYLNSKKVIET